jgi:hypothetical protein
MKHLRLIGVSAVAALVLSALAAASALALEAPEIGRCVSQAGGKYTNNVCTKLAKGTKAGSFEWEPGVVKAHFTGVGGAATLETIHKVKVTCKAEASAGEYTSAKTVGNIKVVFTGCESLGYKCKTPSSAEGEIATNPLSGTLRWEDVTKKKVAIDLVPQSTELFVEFQCGPANAKVKGSVMTNVPGDVVKTVFEQKFSAKKGKQKPEYYYTASGEKVQDVLISKIGGPGAELEQSGQTVTNTQTDEEALEVNIVA